MAYALINKMTTNPGRRQEVIDLMLEAGAPFDDDPACLLYLVSAASDDPDVIWVQDLWTDEAAHVAAMSTEEMSGYVKQAMPLLTGMPEQIEVQPSGGKYPAG